MLTPPPDLDADRLRTALAEWFDGPVAELHFVPVGEDSWCYRAGSMWISLRRDLRGHRSVAYEGAAQLRGAGLEFVLAPLADRSGGVVRRFDGYPVVVFPHIEHATFETAPPSPDEAAWAVAALDRLHRSPTSSDLPVEDFELGFDEDLAAVLTASTLPVPDLGPYSAAVHAMLVADADRLSGLRAEHAALADTCARTAGPWGPTHGEPLASNLLRAGTDLLIADWGDLALGPPERDWSHTLRSIGCGGPCRPAFRRYYDVKWALSEIVEYATILLAEHERTRDTEAMFMRLCNYLSPAASRAAAFLAVASRC